MQILLIITEVPAPMGTLEHRHGIGCRNYMLLNPDRMTMNYTMTDLVRACTALACVACALLSD